MMKNCAWIVLLMMSFPVLSETFSPDKRIQEVIALLKANKSSEAFEKAFEGNHFITQKKTELDQIKYQFVGFVTQVGAPHDCEKLASRNLLDRFRIDQYLCLSDMNPFIIQFDFYRPNDAWKAQAFSFNTSIDVTIEDSIKAELGHLSKPTE